MSRKWREKNKDSRLTNMMLTVFLAFVVCFVPLMLVNILDSDDVSHATVYAHAA